MLIARQYGTFVPISLLVPHFPHQQQSPRTPQSCVTLSVHIFSLRHKHSSYTVCDIVSTELTIVHLPANLRRNLIQGGVDEATLNVSRATKYANYHILRSSTYTCTNTLLFSST